MTKLIFLWLHVLKKCLVMVTFITLFFSHLLPWLRYDHLARGLILEIWMILHLQKWTMWQVLIIFIFLHEWSIMNSPHWRRIFFSINFWIRAWSHTLICDFEPKTITKKKTTKSNNFLSIESKNLDPRRLHQGPSKVWENEVVLLWHHFPNIFHWS